MLSAASVAALGTGAAHAQGQPAEAEVAEVVVTGSQIARSGFTAPTPTTTLGASDLEKVAAPNIAEALNQMPVLRSSLTPSTSTSYSNAAGGNFLDLRGLGFLRTLTLIDGKRYVPSTTTGGLNINIIPQALIGAADVVTGGASAAYGSDAVAGVVNLRLNNALEGVKLTAQRGVAHAGDHRTFLISAAYGEAFADGRGKILLGFELAENTGIPRITDRKWGRAGSIQNPAYTPTNGQPQFIIARDSRAANGAYGGVINSPGVLRGIQFTADGQPTPFTYGTNVTATAMDGGDGIPSSGPAVLESPIKRHSGMGKLTYDITPGLTAFVDFGYAYTRVKTGSNLRVDQLTIRRDNAYLPASIRATMVANNIQTFTMGRGFEDYARGLFDIESRTWQVAGGFKGDLPGGWTFDTYGAYGKTRVLTLYTDDRITARWQQSIDAVVDPSSGQIVCRSTLTAPGNGCVPANFFGYGNVSQAAMTWMNGESRRDWDIRQQVAALTLRGEAFETWAGPIAMAVGGEWRRQAFDVTSDPLSIQNAFRIGNNVPWDAKQNVKEAFAEVLIPLARDMAFAENIDLNLAGRVTDYSASGTVTTWKVGVNYTVNPMVRLRATLSRDIRAPSLDELFAAGNNFTPTIQDPVLGTTYSAQNLTTGNPALTPEKAKAFTAGVVFTPDFIPGLRMSVDYYDIRLRDAINTLNAQAIVTRCYTDTPQFCALLTRPTPTSQITVVRTAPANFQRTETNGVDLEVAYTYPLDDASIDLRALVNYTGKLDLVDGAQVRKFAGNTEITATQGIGGTPHWRFNASAGYRTEHWRVNLTGRYVGGGILTEEFNVDRRDVDGRLYFDLYGEVTVWGRDSADGRQISTFASVQNLADKDPPITQNGTARTLYDVIGRVYTVGLRANF